MGGGNHSRARKSSVSNPNFAPTTSKLVGEGLIRAYCEECKFKGYIFRFVLFSTRIACAGMCLIL